MNKEESEFKYLYLGAHDYCFSSDEHESLGNPLLIHRFLLKLAMYEFGYYYCSNKDCTCHPTYAIKHFLKNDTILNFVRFTDFHYGDGKSIMLKMKELGWIEKGENE